MPFWYPSATNVQIAIQMPTILESKSRPSVKNMKAMPTSQLHMMLRVTLYPQLSSTRPLACVEAWFFCALEHKVSAQ